MDALQTRVYSLQLYWVASWIKQVEGEQLETVVQWKAMSLQSRPQEPSPVVDHKNSKNQCLNIEECVDMIERALVITKITS